MVANGRQRARAACHLQSNSKVVIEFRAKFYESLLLFISVQLKLLPECPYSFEYFLSSNQVFLSNDLQIDMVASGLPRHAKHVTCDCET